LARNSAGPRQKLERDPLRLAPHRAIQQAEQSVAARAALPAADHPQEQPHVVEFLPFLGWEPLQLPLQERHRLGLPSQGVERHSVIARVGEAGPLPLQSLHVLAQPGRVLLRGRAREQPHPQLFQLKARAGEFRDRALSRLLVRLIAPPQIAGLVRDHPFQKAQPASFGRGQFLHFHLRRLRARGVKLASVGRDQARPQMRR
jgi:hypothetical protein